jgi:hypothetical protein
MIHSTCHHEMLKLTEVGSQCKGKINIPIRNCSPGKNLFLLGKLYRQRQLSGVYDNNPPAAANNLVDTSRQVARGKRHEPGTVHR